MLGLILFIIISVITMSILSIAFGMAWIGACLVWGYISYLINGDGCDYGYDDSHHDIKK